MKTMSGTIGVDEGTGKPKRALTAYNIFFKDERQKILKHGKVGGFAALAQAVAKRWKSISKEDYAIYLHKAAQDKERYKRELSEWNESNGKKPRKEFSGSNSIIVQEIQKRMISREQEDAIQRIQVSNQKLQDLYPSSGDPPLTYWQGFSSNAHMDEYQDVSQSQQVQRDSAILGREEYPRRLGLTPSAMPMIQRRIWSQEEAAASCYSMSFPPGPANIGSTRVSPLPTFDAADEKQIEIATMLDNPNSSDHPTVDREHLMFTPGSLSRIFETAPADVASRSEEWTDFPGAYAVDPSIKELVDRILHREEDQKRPAQSQGS